LTLSEQRGKKPIYGGKKPKFPKRLTNPSSQCTPSEKRQSWHNPATMSKQDCQVTVDGLPSPLRDQNLPVASTSEYDNYLRAKGTYYM